MSNPPRAKPCAESEAVSRELALLPQRLRLARAESGLQVTQLEDAAGIGRGAVSRLESDERMGAVTAEKLLRLARALRVRVEWLLTGDGEMKAGNWPPAAPLRDDTPVPGSAVRRAAS